MNRIVTPKARAMAALITLVALASLALQFVVVRQELGEGVFQTLWVMARYLTILTTALIAASFGAIATGIIAVGARWMAALTLSALLVAVGFHMLLRGIDPLVGLEVWADLGFHTIGPILVAIYWIIFAPKGQLSLTDIPFFMTWPAIYLSYALTRGGIDGHFPYPFLDLSAIGWTPVLWTIGGFAVGILVAGILIVILDRVIERIAA